MKAVRFFTYGGPEVLRYEDVERPRPAAGQVLVRVAGTSFNRVDDALRAGFLQQALPLALPHTPGIDVAGTVEELGADVAHWSPGDAVIGLLPLTENGAAAEFVVASADVLAAAPTRIPLPDAAAIPTAALTAWQGLFEHADLKVGQRLLINGAGGGVGGYAIQFAKQAGAVVIATASQRSRDVVHALGADHIVDYTSTRLADAISEPVDVLLNLVSVSEPELAELSRLVTGGGVVVSTITTAQDDTARNVRGLRMFVRSDASQLAAIVDQVDSGVLRVDVSEWYRLSDIAQVHEQGARGAFRGKVVLTAAA
jgi:NADPH:quinone reductase-like Zn-dependent oxidoreductase